MLFSFKVALRFLREGRNQTIFILIGIALGVAIQVFLSNLISALGVSLVDSTIGNTSQLTIQAPKGKDFLEDGSMMINTVKERNKISEYQDIIDALENISDFAAISPTVEGNGLYAKGNTSTSLVVKGIEAERADKIYHIKENLWKGEFSLRSDQILVGKKFAEDNDMEVGDTVRILFPGNKQLSFLIQGIFDLKNEQTNATLVFLDLARTQKIFELGGDINSIETRIAQPFASEEIAENLRGLFPQVRIETWQEKNKQLLIALQSQRSSSNVIQFFLIFSVALGMSSVLAVSVIQKSKEIGILKAMGTNDIYCSAIFMIQGGLLGFIGSTIGYLIGVFIIGFFFRMLNEMTMANYIFEFQWKMVYLTIMSATIIGMIAALFPARKSAALNPMEVIRNG